MKILYVLTLAIIVLCLYLGMRHSYAFRKPTGSYGIGMKVYHMIDQSRSDSQLMVYVHYPTDNKIEKPVTLYDQDAFYPMQDFIAQQTGIPHAWLSDLKKITTYAQQNASLSSSQQTFPVLIFLHGSAPGILNYSWLTQELASQGYVVVGIQKPYLAAHTVFLDGKVVDSFISHFTDAAEKFRWKNEQLMSYVADVQFVIDQFKMMHNNPDEIVYQRLNLEQIGILGHSYGAHVALLAAQQCTDIKAVVAMDGGQRAMPYLQDAVWNKPCLMMFAQNSRQWRDLPGQHEKLKIEQFCTHHKDCITTISIPDVGHGVFTDLPLFMNNSWFLSAAAYYFRQNLDLDASVQICCDRLDLIAQDVITFFDEQLK